jgi:hypothetical protein
MTLSITKLLLSNVNVFLLSSNGSYYCTNTLCNSSSRILLQVQQRIFLKFLTFCSPSTSRPKCFISQAIISHTYHTASTPILLKCAHIRPCTKTSTARSTPNTPNLSPASPTRAVLSWKRQSTVLFEGKPDSEQYSDNPRAPHPNIHVAEVPT